MCCGLSCSIQAIRGLLSVSKPPTTLALLLPTFIKRSSAEVQTKVWLGSDNFTPFHELISTELVGFSSYPSKFWSAFYQLVN